MPNINSKGDRHEGLWREHKWASSALLFYLFSEVVGKDQDQYTKDQFEGLQVIWRYPYAIELRMLDTLVGVVCLVKYILEVNKVLFTLRVTSYMHL